VHSIGFRRTRTQRSGARARNRIEVTVKGHLFTCDQLDFYRAQIQGGSDGRVAEYDMSAK
jgi:hypothetical protein